MKYKSRLKIIQNHESQNQLKNSSYREKFKPKSKVQTIQSRGCQGMIHLKIEAVTTK